MVLKIIPTKSRRERRHELIEAIRSERAARRCPVARWSARPVWPRQLSQPEGPSPKPPPRHLARTAVDDHHSRRATSAATARRRPTSPIPTSSPSIRASMRSRQPNSADPAAVDRRAVVGGAGLERAGPLPRLERHPQQPATALARGRRPRQRLPAARRTTATATPSTSRAGSSPASISTRRVVRYELDGSVTVLADSYNGKRLNSPNDVVPHPDGSYWFTDPPYGGQLYEGAPDAAGGPSNPTASSTRGSASRAGIGRRQARAADQLLSHRSQRHGRSRGHRGPGAGSQRSLLLARLQEALRGQHRQGPGDTGPGGKGEIYVVRRRRGQQALQPASCSATAWSTA